jgi:hypothetical protein
MYFFQLLSHLPENQKRKGNLKLEKSSRAVFSTLAQRCSVPDQILHMRPARYRARASVAAT